jgi:hypothetical protein
MSRLPKSVASLFLLLIVVVTPSMLSSCGGDRYDCDNCGEGKEEDPDETDAEDLAEILPLSFIEAADVTVGDELDVDNFVNYSDVDYRISTVTEASATEYDEDNKPANLAGIGAERWNDDVETLAWEETPSDIDDGKQRDFYLLVDDAWELKTTNNNHELRRYDEKVYDFWLDNTITIKWEIYEAKDQLNNDGVSFPSIAGKHMDDILIDPLFQPPIISNPVALRGAVLWGENQIFDDTTDAEAKIFVVYKQYRPITVEGDVDNTRTETGVAFVPAPAINPGTAFEFQPLAAAVDSSTFITGHTGREDRDRFQINTKLYVSFNPDGSLGDGGEGVILWNSKQTEFEDDVADYVEVTITDGSYIVINLTPEQKIRYGLETYENPLIAFIEDNENNEGAYNGSHLGWLYRPSDTLDVDKPQPHYAFNGPAVTNLKTAFSSWRKLQYCEDPDSNEDPTFATMCGGI